MTDAALLPSRAIIEVKGEDARTFLNGLVTIDMGKVDAHDAGFAALLTPQGKIVSDFHIAAGPESFFLDCRADQADALSKRLTLYRLRAKVSIERKVECAVAAVWGETQAAKEDDGVVRWRDPRLDALGLRLIGMQSSLAGLVANFNDESSYERHRHALGAPELGADFGPDEMFLLDVNYDALNAVDYKKGCFVGQEVSSRMKRKGEIRKRTLAVSFDGAPPESGAAVTAGAATLGKVLSANDERALALIRTDRLVAAEAAGSAPEIAGQHVRITVPAYLEQG